MRTSMCVALTLLVTTACGEGESERLDPSPRDNSVCLVAAGCDSEIANPLLLSSVVINGDGSRTTFLQLIRSFDDGPFDNSTALEIQGNAFVMATEGVFFVGLEEEPTWVRYTVDNNGRVTQDGQLSLLRFGARRIGFANAYVSPTVAVSVIEDEASAVVWNPTTMLESNEIQLPDLVPPRGFTLESFTTTTRNGLVYIPGRFADWTNGRIFQDVRLTILDPAAGEVVATAQDDRCASGGRVVFDDEGYGYVMGDGRNYSNHLFDTLGGETAQDNCILRIPPGGTDFEQSYFHTIPSLTGGLQSITELETASPGSGIGFAKMFYPDELPSGMAVDATFGFWEARAHKLWRIELADPPVAEEVSGIPFSTVGFDGSPIDGLLYTGESMDGVDTDVFAINPTNNSATQQFRMKGLLEGVYPL
ncbi:MAG: hypothetical protein AAFQ82_24050 [Myxococcota bacterium]